MPIETAILKDSDPKIKDEVISLKDYKDDYRHMLVCEDCREKIIRIPLLKADNNKCKPYFKHAPNPTKECDYRTKTEHVDSDQKSKKTKSTVEYRFTATGSTSVNQTGQANKPTPNNHPTKLIKKQTPDASKGIQTVTQTMNLGIQQIAKNFGNYADKIIELPNEKDSDKTFLSQIRAISEVTGVDTADRFYWGTIKHYWQNNKKNDSLNEIICEEETTLGGNVSNISIKLVDWVAQKLDASKSGSGQRFLVYGKIIKNGIGLAIGDVANNLHNLDRNDPSNLKINENTFCLIPQKHDHYFKR